MEDKPLYWIELSDYDLETARAMLEKRRFLYVGFMCHQSVEKAMKAYWQFRKNTHPPKTHNLAWLFEQTGLNAELSAEQIEFIDELDPMNVETRYPHRKDLINNLMTPEFSRVILNKTTELQNWIKMKLSEKPGNT